MSSHREAPEISKDPVADNADTYAFVSPDKPGTVTIITNYVPLQAPPGGPNFFEFGDDVLYSIHIDNNGDALPDVSYEFRFETTLRNPNTFLYNTGPIASLNDANWNKRQFFTVTRVKGKKKTLLASGLACPPCNIGPRSTPDYTALAGEAVHSLSGGVTVFAGQRNDPFFVDLGSIFDLGDLRPFQNLHLIHRRCARRGRDQDAEHPHDRDPGADRRPHSERLRANRCDERELGARHLGCREPAQDAGRGRSQRREV